MCSRKRLTKATAPASGQEAIGRSARSALDWPGSLHREAGQLVRSRHPPANAHVTGRQPARPLDGSETASGGSVGSVQVAVYVRPLSGGHLASRQTGSAPRIAFVARQFLCRPRLVLSIGVDLRLARGDPVADQQSARTGRQSGKQPQPSRPYIIADHTGTRRIKGQILPMASSRRACALDGFCSSAVLKLRGFAVPRSFSAANAMATA